MKDFPWETSWWSIFRQGDQRPHAMGENHADGRGSGDEGKYTQLV